MLSVSFHCCCVDASTTCKLRLSSSACPILASSAALECSICKHATVKVTQLQHYTRSHYTLRSHTPYMGLLVCSQLDCG